MHVSTFLQAIQLCAAQSDRHWFTQKHIGLKAKELRLNLKKTCMVCASYGTTPYLNFPKKSHNISHYYIM